MSIEPTKPTKSCHRVANDNFDRTTYLRLDKNENTTGYPVELTNELLASVTPTMLSSYPEPYRLHKQLAQFLDIDADKILLTTGSDAAIKNCFEAFVKAQDPIIRLDPTYAMAGVYASLFDVKESTIGYDSELNLEFDKLLKQIGPGVKLVYIANPNSPTGTILDIAQLRTLLQKAQTHGTVVLVDEAYYYFTTVTAVSLLDEFDNLIIVRTFSKAMGLASVRLGYLISSPKTIQWLSRWRPMYEINFFAQHCGMFILKHWKHSEKYVQEIIASRKWFADTVKNIGLESYESHANFILIKYPQELINDTVAEFKKNGILIKGGGKQFPLSHSLRFTIGTHSQMERCVRLLQQIIK